MQPCGTAGPKKLTNVQQFEFIRERFNGVGKESTMLSWMVRNASHIINHNGFQSKHHVPCIFYEHIQILINLEPD